MRSFQDVVVVVSGAASGIGRASALTFSRLGAKLALADIQEGPLADLAREIYSNGGSARAFDLDVSDREQVGSFAEAVLCEFGKADVIVNSAGVLILGETRLVSLEDFRWLMGVNFWGAVHLVHFFLPSMIERRRGHIVNISSPNALAPVPFVGPYAASKAALDMFSDTLRIEVADFGVGVTTVCPGFTRTEMRAMAKYRAGTEAREDYLRHVREHVKGRELDPFEVARRIPSAVLKNRAHVRISAETRLLSWSYRLVPGLFRRAARYAVKRTP